MIWWLAGAGLAAGALGYKKIFGDQTCNAEEVLGKIKLLLNAKTTFDKIVGNAFLTGAIPASNTVFYTQAKTLVDAINNSPVAALAIQTAVPWDTATTCSIWQQAAALGQQLVTLSQEFSRITGQAPPVPAPPLDAPPGDTLSRLFWGAAIVGGAYLAYMALSQGEYIPAKLLPRYAGGKRKEA